MYMYIAIDMYMYMYTYMCMYMYMYMYMYANVFHYKSVYAGWPGPSQARRLEKFGPATFGRAVCRRRSAGFAGVAVPGPAADVQPAHAKRIEPMGVPMGQLSQADWVPMWQLSQANGS